MAGVNSAAGKVSSKSVFGGQFGGGEKFGCGKSVFEKRLREVIRWRGEIRLREKCLRKTSSRGNSVAEGNSAAGKVSSPDHINVSSKKVFGGARKSATRNACAMNTWIGDLRNMANFMSSTCYELTPTSTPKCERYKHQRLSSWF